ncbi:amidohydrolase family protein [Cutibacterium sp.]|uniref:amidohydrolase family protein n=1 Tax=Cutibacterium sp. TaxID=1912221 RepID=UPI0026DB4709|nr:amidohydrolase family protein [Cutibacterium sp.]MDO4413272.1 amidohydrolase family protein [Cutibacterium sp.]
MTEDPQPLFHTHSHDGWTHTHIAPEAHTAPAEDLRIRGVVLPEGEERELWVHDGVLVAGPLPGARTLADGCWVIPGLVDAHNHIGLDRHGAVDRETAEEQAGTETRAGTLLIRDAGSPSDTHWIDKRDDLPRIIRAGRHIARPKRYIRNYAAEVDPEDLVAEVDRQARSGDGWVKLVGDWIDRAEGDLAPLWPADVAKDAIARAHELGARVTAHCFSEEAPAQLVDAGIDCIEHGTGLTDDTISTMAERGVGLVPTLVNIETFPSIATQAEAKFPTYAAHMRHLHAHRMDTIGKAFDAGVPIYAGTDAGGTIKHGLISSEVRLLAAVGGAEMALGAASWRARAWLGGEQLNIGDSADLLVLDRDPRTDVTVLESPEYILLRGRVVIR